MSFVRLTPALIAAALIISGCTSDEWGATATSDELDFTPIANAMPPAEVPEMAEFEVIEPVVVSSETATSGMAADDFAVAADLSGMGMSIPSETIVGKKVKSLRGEFTELKTSLDRNAKKLAQLRTRSQQHADEYYTLIASISARLQGGTTPGNPYMVQKWNMSQAKLEQLAQDLADLNGLASGISSNASLAAFLVESIRSTYGLSGAVEADHAFLAALENDVLSSVVKIDKQLNALSDEINRQSAYMTNERNNLQTLSLAITNGEMYGRSLANRAFGKAPAKSITGQKPLVIIRFDRPNVDYAQQVYQAISQALERYPQASFELVAVSPSAGNAAQVALASSEAKRNAEDVLRTLTQMGLPSERIALSAMGNASVNASEVHIFVR
ncbi:MAG: hypothetical protein U9N14_01265 [Pseudomonadota bacterium]|nr:hypothetical protein [Pseudomonadota bacterium]